MNTNVCVGSAIARAVIVAVSFAGTFFGGVYTADVEGAGAGFRVPQLGAQLVFAIDNSQLTPWSPPGPLTLAVIVTASEPADTIANVSVKLTTTGPLPDFDPDPHEARPRITTIVNAANAIRFMATFGDRTQSIRLWI
ncbi:MAG: hypothetical protein NVS9B14_11960 [Candidatus Acidiferrum sp.]